MKNLLITAGTALVVALAAVTFMSPTETETQKPVGAVSSPDIISPYYTVGGVPVWKQRTDSLIQASTTVCSLQSPAATSTLLTAGIRFALASSSAMVVDLARSSSPAATTTKIGTTYNIAAGAQATIIASSTGSVAGDATIFPPNTYFVVKMDTGTGATFNAPTGTCEAVWQAF